LSPWGALDWVPNSAPSRYPTSTFVSGIVAHLTFGDPDWDILIASTSIGVLPVDNHQTNVQNGLYVSCSPPLRRKNMVPWRRASRKGHISFTVSTSGSCTPSTAGG
jgi:hypothetical protein